MTEVSIAIQHHPARAGLLAGLLAAIPGAEVVTDPEPAGVRSPWRTYRRALEQTPPGCTHRAILQDDSIPCAHFVETLNAAVAAQPTSLLVLCVCGQPVRAAHAITRAAAGGRSWVLLMPHRWVPAIALVWPADVIPEALRYVDSQHWPPRFSADDEIIGRIAQKLRLPLLATVPSLVSHDDHVQSANGGRRAMFGQDSGRVTACPMAEGCDPRQIDWTVPPESASAAPRR